jgi:mono/diheme cytochrome c family protein
MASLHDNLAVRPLASALIACLLLPASALADGTVTKSVDSGRDIFVEHCASCHGSDATGNGPAAVLTNTPPADLTRITERAGGTFPAARVMEIITYGGKIAAHGSGPMPVWGKIFSVEGGGGKGGAFYSRRAVIALKRYLENIQR